MTLSARTFSAARWTTASTVMRAVLQLGQITVLARFLSPQDYGLMAMVTVVLSYAALFSDMGLSTAFIQRSHVSHDERSSLYWLSVIVGAALMVLVMLISPLAAHFFKEPQLVALMMLAATNFLVTACGQQLRMDAEKNLNFRPVAMIEMAAALGGFVVAVVMASLQWGVYALVAASMVTAWTNMVLAWLVLARGWRPSLRLKWNEVRWFVRFGGGMLVNNVINHMNSTVDLLLGGRVLGAAQLGLYSVPRNLILQVQGMVNPIFTRVGFPLIASIQHDKQQVRQVYLMTMNMTASVNAPIFVFIGVFAHELALVLLGEAWQNAAPLLQVLAGWGLLRSFANPVGSLLFGLGRVRLSIGWNLGALLLIPPILFVSARWGSLGLAWGMASIMAALLLPAWAILVRPTCGATLREYLPQIAVPSLLAALSGAAALATASVFGESWVRLLAGAATGGMVYLLLCSWFNKALIQSINGLLGRKQPVREEAN